mmetsp:Transcript_21524/g.48771  ORF Transcript_21524/g.48771 Transcript_21524/m.48771 type:complete len:258 (-) Transcript_21524:2858-3631(-)
MEDLHNQTACSMPENSAASPELRLALHVLPRSADVLPYCTLCRLTIQLTPLMLPLRDSVGLNLFSPLCSFLQRFGVQHTRRQLLNCVVDDAEAMRLSGRFSTGGAIILVLKPFHETRPTEDMLISADSVCIQNQSLADGADVLLTQFFSLVLNRSACHLGFEDGCEFRSIRPPGRVKGQELFNYPTQDGRSCDGLVHRLLNKGRIEGKNSSSTPGRNRNSGDQLRHNTSQGPHVVFRIVTLCASLFRRCIGQSSRSG